MYSRKLQSLIEELLSEFHVLYLTGPRHAGKTTLARAVAEYLARNADTHKLFLKKNQTPKSPRKAFVF